MMPHHATEQFLAAAVSSILAQDYRDFELHFVDDCSPTDARLPVLGPFRGDNRLRIWRTSRQVGPYRIKNTLLREKISSPLVAFMDSDDVSHPRRLSIQVGAMRRWGAQVVGTGFRYVDQAGRPYRTLRRFPWPNLAMKWDARFPMLHPTQLCTRASLVEIGGFDGTTRFGGDFDYALRARYLFRLWNTPHVLYDWRQHPASLTHRPESGLGSEARKAYEAAILGKDLARRGLRGDALRASVQAPPNDVDFELIPE